MAAGGEIGKDGRIAKRRTLIAQIRFQLDQLSSSNSHHEFEHITRHFARDVITRSILPATGPVSAGGDGGRDFETFTTFIRKRETRSSVFRADHEAKKIVFACSITDKSRIRAKIKSDIATICGDAAPDIIYFFSNQSVNIATRRELQTDCASTHSCQLEVIDAEALSEHLAEANLFWIAEEFLHVPSDLFPDPPKSGSAYDDVREHWLEGGYSPATFADFINVKHGLRRATFTNEYKPDVTRWLALMDELVATSADEALVRKAKYEICVATLRGLHDLRPRRSFVEDLLGDWARWTSLAELRDTAVLLSYVSGAILHGEFEFDLANLHQYCVDIAGFLDKEIKACVKNPNRLADLIYTRSSVSASPFLRGKEPEVDIAEQISWWFKLVAAAEEAPLFGLESFIDGLTSMTSIHYQNPDFMRLTHRAEEVFAKRVSQFVVAEKCRDRAFALLHDGKVLAAISELHRAKLNWFSGEMIEATILTLLTLSRAYRELGLTWAAKYHTYGAAFIAHSLERDELKHRFVAALHELATISYLSGEWVALSDLVPVVLVAHYQYSDNADEWGGHPRLHDTVQQFFISRSIARALHGDQADLLLITPLMSIKEDGGIRRELSAIPEAFGTVGENISDKVRSRFARELQGIPFCDTGSPRIYRWTALGITWNVSCENKRETLAQVEQLVAILQIALTDLASSELLLQPTIVNLDAALGPVPRVTLETLPTNTTSAMKVFLPDSFASESNKSEEARRDVCLMAIEILRQCSCLDDARFLKVVDRAFQNGLRSKLFMARPYDDLFLEFNLQMQFDERRKLDLKPENAPSWTFPEPTELAWPTNPGPGYTKSKSEKAIRNRYERASRPIQVTLARLRKSLRFQRWVTEHRERGRQDWWILLVLMNTVLNYRKSLVSTGLNPSAQQELVAQMMSSEESDEAPPFPEELLYDDSGAMNEKFFLATTAKGWGLVLRNQTPDFAALEKLLGVRYGQYSDDVDHVDPFYSVAE